jgi:hypothetical protein
MNTSTFVALFLVASFGSCFYDRSGFRFLFCFVLSIPFLPFFNTIPILIILPFLRFFIISFLSLHIIYIYLFIYLFKNVLI